MEKRYILFDLDGTLTDSYEGISKGIQYALKTMGVESEVTDFSFAIGPPLNVSFESKFGFDKEQTERAILLFREYYDRQGKFENRPYDGVPEMLRTLNAHGKKLMIATAKPEFFAVDIAEHFGLAESLCFIGGVTHESAKEPSAEARATKKDVIGYILQTNGITEPEKTVMVGDRAADILAAKAHGLVTIGVCYGYGTREELQEAGADYLAESPEDITRIIIED